MPSKNSHMCCQGRKLRKGLWSPDEDARLVQFIRQHGIGRWSSVPKRAGLQRCGKSCRLRWINYLRPDLKCGTFSPSEVMLIIRLHSLLGNRWSRIASCLPGRTDNQVKNFWNSILKKRLTEHSQLIKNSAHLMADHYEINLVEESIDTSPELTKTSTSNQSFAGGFSSSHTLIYGDLEVGHHDEQNTSHELSENQGSIEYTHFMQPLQDFCLSDLQTLHDELSSTVSKHNKKLPCLPSTQEGLPSSLVSNQNIKTSIVPCLITCDSHTPLQSPLLSQPLSHDSLKANQIIDNATNISATYNVPLLSQEDQIQASFLDFLDEVDSLNNSSYIFDSRMDLSMLLLGA